MFADWFINGSNTSAPHHISLVHSTLPNPLADGGTFGRQISNQGASVNRFCRFRSILPAHVNIPQTKAISVRASVRSVKYIPVNYISFAGVFIGAPDASDATSGWMAVVGNGIGAHLGPTGVVTALYDSDNSPGSDPAFPTTLHAGLIGDNLWARVRVDRVPSPAGDFYRAYFAPADGLDTWSLVREAFVPLTSDVYLGWPCPSVGFIIQAGYQANAARGYIDNVQICLADV